MKTSDIFSDKENIVMVLFFFCVILYNHGQPWASELTKGMSEARA